MARIEAGGLASPTQVPQRLALPNLRHDPEGNLMLYQIKNWRAYKDRFLQRRLSGLNALGGMTTMRAELHAKFIRGDGTERDLGLLSARVVTNAGVTYMRDDFNAATGAADITNFKFNASGTGSVAENVTDTALGTDSGVARVTGSQGVGAGSNTYVTVGTMNYVSTLAITEHGIFSASSAGTLWDRSVFAAINVVSGDAIQFTYTLTITAGG